MTRRGPRALGATVAALVAGAVLVAVEGASPAREEAARGREFQALVGGLGFGFSLDLAGGESAFDPRVGAVSSVRLGPVPAGDAFSRAAHPDPPHATPGR